MGNLKINIEANGLSDGAILAIFGMVCVATIVIVFMMLMNHKKQDKGDKHGPSGGAGRSEITFKIGG